MGHNIFVKSIYFKHNSQGHSSNLDSLERATPSYQRKKIKLTSPVGNNMQAGDLLPLASPSLQGLKSLAIMFGDLDDFPDPVASCLQQLTHLDLTGNFFTCIPSALSHITTLVILYMGGNQELELQRGDISLLHSLPDLEVLEVSKRLPENAGDESGFSQKSIGVLLEMAYTFPSLHLAGLDMNDQSDSDADHSDSD